MPVSPEEGIELTEQGATHLAEVFAGTLVRLGSAEAAARAADFDASGFLTEADIQGAADILEAVAGDSGLEQYFAEIMAVQGMHERIEKDSSNEALEHNRAMLDAYKSGRNKQGKVVQASDDDILKLAHQLNVFRMDWLADHANDRGPTLVEFGWGMFQQANQEVQEWVAQGGDVNLLLPSGEDAGASDKVVGDLRAEEVGGIHAMTVIFNYLTPRSQDLFVAAFEHVAGEKPFGKRATRLVDELADDVYDNQGTG